MSAPEEAVMDASKPVVLDDALWEEMCQRNSWAPMACYQCGTCTATCPWGLVRGKPLSVRSLLHESQLGFTNGAAAADLWLCTSCRACEARCPRGVEIVDSIFALRGAAHSRHDAPEALEQALWGIYEEGNPWAGRRTDRRKWASGLGVKDAREGVDVVLYVGCTASYDPRIQRVAKAIVRLFQAADLDFGILGSAESCCGDVVHSMGESAFLEELVEKNAQALAPAGASSVVTLSPHCLVAQRRIYPQFGVELPVRHYTEVLAELIGEGRLPLTQPAGVRVTYHDPCFLGRQEGLYDPPRAILEAIPDLELVEMPSTRENALCCGGGAGRMWLETKKGERLSDLRVGEAQTTEASVLATACPNCIQNFEDSLKTGRDEALDVLDVAELAAAAL